MHEDRAGWADAYGAQHFVSAGTIRARCGTFVGDGVRRPEPKRGAACRDCVRLEMGFAPGE